MDASALTSALPEWNNVAFGLGSAVVAAAAAALHFSRTLPEVPELWYQRTAKNERIVRACTLLREPYHPPIGWGWNGHIQTVFFGAVDRLQTPQLAFERVLLPTPDGAVVSVDCAAPKRVVDTTPVVVVCPGLCNSSENLYVRAFAVACVQAGYRVVVFNHHGTPRDVPIVRARLFTFGYTVDVEQAVRWAMRTFAAAPIAAVGFSMGANLIVRLVGQHKDIQQRLCCVVSACQGYDAIKSAEYIMHTASMYNAVMTAGLKRLVKMHQDVIAKQRPDIDVAAVLATNEVTEFDRLFTVPTFSSEYTSVEHYYSSASSAPYLPELRLPTLLINTADDPLVSPEVLHVPIAAAQANPNIIHVKTRHGGHLGFYEGTVFPNEISWMDRLIVDYISSVIAV